MKKNCGHGRMSVGGRCVDAPNLREAFTWNSGGHMMLDMLGLRGNLTVVISDELVCLRRGTPNGLIYGDPVNEDDDPWMTSVCAARVGKGGKYLSDRRRDLKPLVVEHPEYGDEELSHVSAIRDSAGHTTITTRDGLKFRVTPEWKADAIKNLTTNRVSEMGDG